MCPRITWSGPSSSWFLGWTDGDSGGKGSCRVSQHPQGILVCGHGLRNVDLKEYFLKCYPWTRSRSITWALIKHAYSAPPPPACRPTESGGWVRGSWLLSVLEQALEAIVMLTRTTFPERTGILILCISLPWMRVEREPGVKIEFTFIHLLASWWTQPKLWTGWCYDSQPVRWNRQCDISNNSLI